ncbi:MAG: ABC transporter permease [Bacteroidota bacterium]
MNRKPSPPEFLLCFFRWFCHPEYVEDIEGDLMERFKYKVEEKGIRVAKLRLAKDIIQLFRPGIIRSMVGSYQLNYYGMFQNFLKSGWRSFIKYKTNSLINVFGLSIGIAATILLYLIIDYERSFDQFHEQAENIYRVADKFPNGDQSDMIVTPLLPNLLNEYPEIESGTRFLGWDDIFLYKEKALYLDFCIVDKDFPSVFSFESVHGNIAEALSMPGNIVLTESIAQKLFGDDNPIGEVLKMKDLGSELIVAGVVKAPPKNSSLQFKALMSWPASPNLLDEDQMGNWYNTFMTAYIRLSDNADVHGLETKTPDFTKKHYLENRKDHQVIFLPLLDEHARNTKNDRRISTLVIIAMAILVISSVNLMNLSMSQWLTRTREIGVRKVLGSRKGQLMFQFLIEGLITTATALIFALLLVFLFVPYVNAYYDLDIQYQLLKHSFSLLFIIGMCLSIGTISSLSISVLLSSVHVIKSLKEKIKWSNTGQWLQKGLIIFQFSISLVFIAGTMVIWKQINFMKSYDLKFNSNYVVSLDAHSSFFKEPKKALQDLKLLRNDLPKESSIEEVSLSQNMPGKYANNYNWFVNLDSNGIDGVHLKQITVDYNYFSLLDIKLIHGRNFSEKITSDKKAIIINEAAWKKLGWESLENKFLRPGSSDNEALQVVGVVQDYHYRSLKESIEPLIHFYNAESTNKLLVKLNPHRIDEGLQKLQKSWLSLNPYQPFDYKFIDEEYDQQYKAHERLGITATAFSSIAVIIALLGLFSIASFVVKNRRKEIGVRKVLGATLAQIIVLLSKRFVVLVGVAFTIATPIIYFLSEEFLADFTYRMELSPFVFITSGMLILLLAIMIVSLQSGKAAVEDPVRSLKNE